MVDFVKLKIKRLQYLGVCLLYLPTRYVMTRDCVIFIIIIFFIYNYRGVTCCVQIVCHCRRTFYAVLCRSTRA